MKNELDRRRKYYLILDCETATLPIASKWSEEKKKKVSIAKPLIYDLGWTIVDKKGNIYRRQSFLISEIFSVPQVFNTAYYKDKRPIYLERLRHSATILTDWKSATEALVHDMGLVDGVGAYNAMFDFKKALPFTELYISKVYSEDYYEWEKFQFRICEDIAEGKRKESNQTFDPDHFTFRGITYNLFDVWGLACRHILNCDEYRELCSNNGWVTPSGLYYKSSAETAFRFCAEDYNFEEAHTALDDAEIESFIFSIVNKRTKGKFEMGIEYFPFKLIGKIS